MSSSGEEFAGPCRWAYQNPFRNVSSPDLPEASALQYSHRGMLAVLPNGSLASAWQAAPVYWEGSNEQGIYWALSNDHGLTWSRCSLLVSPDGLPAWGPVMHVEVRLVLWGLLLQHCMPVLCCTIICCMMCSAGWSGVLVLCGFETGMLVDW